ncbi:Apoptosis-related protein/predicted DNA-binding protein [Trachipleistophora hominis]|uniref:Apoptosis-related protein/predicted DNA-binding protein n=1 Tax=Trachipleistophora hominis TaxID=72359 RepID=L7JUH0_TRAHO|nr:Apoptosis-related protein/predicted DNA-binding protein [Trachipleistophora hominis]
MSQQPNTDQLLASILEPASLTRFNRIKLYNKDRAKKIENELIRLYKSGRVQRQINEDEFEEFVSNLCKENAPRIVVMRKRNEGDL